MKKTKIRIMGFLMTALLALSAPLVYADNGNGGNLAAGQGAVSNDQSSSDQGDHEWKHRHWGRHGDHMKGWLLHKLKLTDDQKKQMKDLWQKQRETMKATFEQFKANREALDKELILATPDLSKINDLQAQLKTLQAQMVDNRLNSTLEVKKILTPEQFGKYLELQKKLHKHGSFGRHCRHHHRHHGHYDGNYHKHWGDDGDHYDND